MTASVALKILVVEDHHSSREALRLSLENWSHEVFTVASGDEALPLLEKHPEIQVMLTDWRLPGMDGLELCRRVRAQKGRYLYIIVMTARNERGDRIRALEAGADGFIDKPLDLHELRSQISVAERLWSLEGQLGNEISKLKTAHTELKEEYEIRETIRSFGIQLAGELEREKLLHSFLEAAVPLVGAEFGAFVPLGAKPEEVVSKPSAVPNDQIAEWSKQIPMETIDGGRNREAYRSVLGRDRHTEIPRVGSLIVETLLTASGQTLGALYLTHPEPGVFGERERRTLQGLAAQASVALDNARLYEDSVESERRLREKNRELQERFRQLEILRAESEANQQNLDQVLSSIQEAFVLLDPALRFLYINDQAAVMAQSTWEEMEGKSFWELFPDFVGTQLDEGLQKVALGSTTHRLEEFYPSRERYYEHRIHPSSQGRLSIFSTDITEAKQAELAARKTELWLRAIFDQTSGFFAILHPDGRVAQVNQASLESTGSTADDVLERPIWQVDWWEVEGEKQRLKESLAQASQGTRVREIASYRNPDGSQRRMDRSLTPIVDEVGQIRYVLVEGLDITDLKRTEKELEQARDQALLANRMKSQFLANMSHEIRTPLSGIRGMTEFLQDTTLEEDQTEYVEAIGRCSQNLLAIVGDVLDLSRIEAGEMEIREAAFDLRITVKDLVALFAYRAREKNVELTCDIEDGLPKVVTGDPDRLRQLLVNLVNNALKFTDAGTIRVVVSRDPTAIPERILFEVQDTGIGIPEEAQKKLFQPFSQVDSSPSRKHGGTGLGLSIVKKLVILMEGEVGCRSVHNEGSVFWFSLPLPLSTEEAVEVGEPSEPLGEEAHELVPHLRVLVAEDSPINRRVVLLQLQRSGVYADAVSNGREVLEALREKRYHLILMDCQMPELDGYQATQEIRNSDLEGSQDIVIIALTAHALKGEREKCLAAGMDDYEIKPLSIVSLRRLLLRWCLSPRIRSAIRPDPPPLLEASPHDA